MTFFDYALIAVNLLALVVPSIIFRLIAKQDKVRNKFLADELERLQERWQDLNKTNSFHHDKAHEWMKRFKGLEELAAETGEQHKKQIAELKNELAQTREAKKRWANSAAEWAHKHRTAWHAHQVVKKGKQVICLTTIVEASDGPGAVAAFEAQMKEVKRRIRSKAPVFAKPVFPNI